MVFPTERGNEISKLFGVSYKVYDGGVIFEGTFKDGKKNGKGKSHILMDQALILALKENLNVILK